MVGTGDVLLVHGCQDTVLHVEVMDVARIGAGQRQWVGHSGYGAAVWTGSVLLNETRAVTLAGCQR